MGSVIVFSTKKQRKRLQIPVNHEFTGIFVLAKMQKKASKSGLSVAYSVYIPRTDNAVFDNENSYDSI